MDWKIIVCFMVVGHAFSQNPDCDYRQNLIPGQTYYAYSRNYPNNYPGGITCRWIAICPSGYNCRAECNDIALPQSNQCSMDRLLISRTGDPSLAGADTYCGVGRVTAVSENQQLSIGLITSPSSPGGRFSCTLTAQAIGPVNPPCSCGNRRMNRIVGGIETGVNEFPHMAGIIDTTIYSIKCGGVIIHEQYVLTAGHCLLNRNINEMAVVVGEHNVNSNQSPARQVLRVTDYVIHPQYSSSNYDYDAGLVMTATRMLFSDRVGPVCLPFKFTSTTFAGSKVTALGWGTLFPGGPTSEALQKVDLDVMSQNTCQQQVSTVTPRQMCTFTPGKDACQDDSGGPLLYTDPATGLLFSVGIISFGRFCASNEPGVNTRVTTILNWVTSMTPNVNYCMK